MTTTKFARRWKYGALINVSAQEALAYRVTMIIEWIVDAWSVLVMLYIWGTIFASQSTRIGVYDWAQMKTYLIIAHAINAFAISGVAWAVAAQIRDGDIVTHLTRPIDYVGARFVEQFGGSLITGVIGAGLVTLLSVVFLRLMLPASLVAALLFVVSLLAAYVVSFFVSFLLGLSTAWLMNNQGISWMVWYGGRLLSGAVIPLSLFPSWLSGLPYLTPFHCIVADPLAIYLGHVQGIDALRVIGLQALWALGLYLFVRWIWPRAMRHLDVQGG